MDKNCGLTVSMPADARRHAGRWVARGVLQHLRPGDRVWAPWKSDTLFAGTVDQIQDKEVHIPFRRRQFRLGAAGAISPVGKPFRSACASWPVENGLAPFPGTVTAVEGDRIHIAFDDGARNGPGLPPWRCRVSLMARMCGRPRKCRAGTCIGAGSSGGNDSALYLPARRLPVSRANLSDDIDPFRRKLTQ